MLIIDSKLKKHCEEVPDLIHAEVDSVIGLGMSREGFSLEIKDLGCLESC